MDFHQARWSDADIQIWRDDSGKPHALGEWGDHLSSKIDIAIAHTAQFVIALAAANARVGVDVESATRDLSEEFTAGVFVPEELELAANAANASQAIIRFWCAKEAVSKALGTHRKDRRAARGRVARRVQEVPRPRHRGGVSHHARACACLLLHADDFVR